MSVCLSLYMSVCLSALLSLYTSMSGYLVEKLLILRPSIDRIDSCFYSSQRYQVYFRQFSVTPFQEADVSLIVDIAGRLYRLAPCFQKYLNEKFKEDNTLRT